MYKKLSSLTLFALVLLLAVLSIGGLSFAEMAENEFTKQWIPLCQQGKFEDARRMCEGWLSKKGSSNVQKAEAHKCLANVEIGQAEVIARLQSDDAGGAAIVPHYDEAAVSRAVDHLNAGIELTPNDISIHQGRLHILIESGRYSETKDALADTLKRYKGPDAFEDWIAYSYDLFNLKQYQTAVDYLKTLEKSYPENNKIAANLGGMLFMMGKDEEGIKYAQKALRLSPEDPINIWNLGRMYDYTGDIEQADKYYRKALEIYGKPDDFDSAKYDIGGGADAIREDYCLYAEFVADKLKDKERACKLRKEGCPDAYEELCVEH